MSNEASVLEKTSTIPGLRQQPQGQPPQIGLTHLPLTSPRGYYRTKVLNLSTGINPLVTAAATLFITCATLRESQPYVLQTHELFQELQHEIKAFETQAQTLNYRSELILVARYILCATIDEIILATPWGNQSDWHKHKLLIAFHNEDWGAERVFFILERLSADPSLHIDILELIYLCLSLGFKGKYQFIENGQAQLETAIENLYQTIRWQRGEIKKELLISKANANAMETTAPVAEHEPLPLWLLLVFMLMLISTLYVIFNFMLGSSTSALFQQFNNTFLKPYG